VHETEKCCILRYSEKRCILLVPLLPTGRSRVIKKFSSGFQSKTSWPSLQYSDYACNRKKHITGACNIIAERYGIVFTTQRKRGRHKARVGNLCRVAGQKQTLQCMRERTNFPPTFRSFTVVKFWEFMEF